MRHGPFRIALVDCSTGRRNQNHKFCFVLFGREGQLKVKNCRAVGTWGSCQQKTQGLVLVTRHEQFISGQYLALTVSLEKQLITGVGWSRSWARQLMSISIAAFRPSDRTSERQIGRTWESRWAAGGWCRQ